MFTEIDGDLFSTSADAIGHGVNLHGVMGAGIAVQFERRWPEMMPDYVQWCRTAVLGDIMIHRPLAGPVVVNIASQERPGADARMGALSIGVLKAMDSLRASGAKSLAIPRIGCGIGGLEYSDVRKGLQHISTIIPEVDLIVVTPSRGTP